MDDLLYNYKIDVDAKVALEFGMSIASGMSHIHRENILHCDLGKDCSMIPLIFSAARNLLVFQSDGKYSLKVCVRICVF